MTDHQQDSQGAIPKRRYAIYFNEGDGYYLIDWLGRGAFSVTMLVLSRTDNTSYVRKLHHVQTFKPELGADQCSDARNVVSQSHIPRLIHTEYYKDRVPTISHDDFTESSSSIACFVTPATTWQFCNGGSLDKVLEIWDGKDYELEEAFLWGFLKHLMTTLLHVLEQGLVHGDIHPGNIFLHFSPGKSFPEPFLADFGQSERYPVLTSHRFQNPWSGDFDNSGHPISTSLTDVEKASIVTFYYHARDDVAQVLFCLQSLIFGGRSHLQSTRNDANGLATAYFTDLVRQNRTVNGYSSAFIRCVAAWMNVLSLHPTNPVLLMNSMKQLLTELQSQAARVIGSLNIQTSTNGSTLRDYLDPDQYRTRPMLWKDPQSLLEPEDASPGNLFINPTDHDRASDAFDRYLYGSWRLEHPLVEASHPELLFPLHFQTGHFSVVEVEHDEATGRIAPLRTISSMNDVGPLSPDSPSSDYYPGDDDDDIGWDNPLTAQSYQVTD